jgi:prevent-host-death family protein
MPMATVNVTEFRQHLPVYLKRVAAGEEIRITSRGKIIARLLPERNEAEAARERLAAVRGTMILDDVVSPIEEVEWSADEDHL